MGGKNLLVDVFLLATLKLKPNELGEGWLFAQVHAIQSILAFISIPIVCIHYICLSK
jgi:hypothetical protein